MVEFDVQLSKDMIPVIYHDFHVSISLKRKKQIDAMDMLEIPVKDLTLEQLHLLKVSLIFINLNSSSTNSLKNKYKNTFFILFIHRIIKASMCIQFIEF